MTAAPKQPMLKSPLKDQFWVTNFSQRNVSLADLGFTIHKGRSYNLLSSHFPYTKEQLLLSAESGSLHKKSHMVRIVPGPPQQVVKKIYLSDQPIQIRKRSAVKIEEVDYEELNVSDEQYAEEFLEDYE